MLSSNSAKVFFVFFFVFTLFSACSWWQAENKASLPTPFIAEETKSGIPFSTKEPENYQAEFVVTTDGKEDITFTARKNDFHRFDYNFGQKNQVSSVQTADNKNFLLFSDKKIYTENSGNLPIQNNENSFDFLTTEWLNQKAEAKFESLGTENGLKKYRVILGGNQISESVIWIDENIGLPVKQEFYSVSGEQKNLIFAFEIRNFLPQTEDGLFEIPKDFRKVSADDFRKVLRDTN